MDVHQLLEPFLPPHVLIGGKDPFTAVEQLLTKVAENRGQISLYAIPTFVWFSTRLFAGIRTSLNYLYDVSLRPPKRRHFVVAWLLGKLRDVAMVVATIALFFFNTVASTTLSVLQARSETVVAPLDFFLTTLGRILGQGLAFLFALLLFFIVYRFASIRRLPWRPAVVASVFTTIAFEIAKRLFGFYLAHVVAAEQLTFNANLLAVILFVLWVFYTAIVFLLGGVVAETWDLRNRLKEQRAVLT